MQMWFSKTSEMTSGSEPSQALPGDSRASQKLFSSRLSLVSALSLQLPTLVSVKSGSGSSIHSTRMGSGSLRMRLQRLVSFVVTRLRYAYIDMRLTLYGRLERLVMHMHKKQRTATPKTTLNNVLRAQTYVTVTNKSCPSPLSPQRPFNPWLAALVQSGC